MTVQPKAEVMQRFAEHLAYVAFGPGGDCEVTGFSGSGRCIEPAVAIRWESGFADEVCEEHARRAEDRGAIVVHPRKQDGT